MPCLNKLKADPCILEKTNQLTSYFQRTCINGERIAKNKSDATFPIELWNQSEEKSQGLIRTTKAVEGCHWGVSALFQGSHPPITFLVKFRLDASNQKLSLLKATTGNVNRGGKKYLLLDEKLQQVLAD